ncbi:MAG: biopolymer transporter ExbD [Gammaproteobacteria bacterium]|nr:MAG: biopolymer transporter ExbD [Gammaproteobacteria bacterium]
MNLKPRRTEDPEINLTSLIDVVFLMLIFFMVSTTFEKSSLLQLVLPSASQKAIEKPDTPLEILISAEGVYYVNGRELVNNEPKTLKRAIEVVVQGNTDMPFTIRADARTPHQSVVTAMDVASQIGLVRVFIATIQQRDTQ